MQTQLLLDLNDLAELIGDSELIKKTFGDKDWVIKWHCVDDEFQFKVIVSERDDEEQE